MLVPELERPLAAGVARAARAIELVGVERRRRSVRGSCRGSLPAQGRIAVGDRLWASHLLGLQRALPNVSFEPASPVIGRLRAVKDDDELAALRRAARGADECFRADLHDARSSGAGRSEIAADLADLLGAQRACARRLHDRGEWAERARRLTTNPGRRTILPRRRRRDGLRRRARRVLQRHHAHRGRGGTTRRVRARLRGGSPGAGRRRARPCAPGVEAQEVDRVARRIIDDAGFGDRVHPSHRPRHRARGARAAVHRRGERLAARCRARRSRWSPASTSRAEFGVRIEDIVAVTSDGVERLNRSTRELQVVE